MASDYRAVQSYRLTLDSIVRAYTALIEKLIIALYDPDDKAESAKKITDLAVDITRQHRARAWEAGISLLKHTARDAGVYDPFIPTQPGYPDKSVETVLRKHLRGNRQEAARKVADMLAIHVEDAGRAVAREAVEQEELIEDDDWDDGLDSFDGWDEWDDNEYADVIEQQNKPDDTQATKKQIINGRVLRHKDLHNGKRPFGYARVLTGAENCAFCVMLASRGPVYSSAKAAGARTVSTAYAEAGVVEYINSYHPNCDCIVVPVYTSKDWPGKEQFEAAQALYNEVTGTEWTDKHGVRQAYISYNHGPSYGKGNQVILELNKRLKKMKEDGKALPVVDIRSLDNGRLKAGRR